MSSSQSDNNKRIAKNTLMLYVRMLFLSIWYWRQLSCLH